MRYSFFWYTVVYVPMNITRHTDKIIWVKHFVRSFKYVLCRDRLQMMDDYAFKDRSVFKSKVVTIIAKYYFPSHRRPFWCMVQELVQISMTSESLFSDTTTDVSVFQAFFKVGYLNKFRISPHSLTIFEISPGFIPACLTKSKHTVFGSPPCSFTYSIASFICGLV